MLSIQRCREILEKAHPEYAGLSDQEVEQIRDFLYLLATVEKMTLDELLQKN